MVSICAGIAVPVQLSSRNTVVGTGALCGCGRERNYLRSLDNVSRLNQATVRADMHGDTHNVCDEQYRVTERKEGDEREREREREREKERKQGKEKVKAELDPG